jgi:hypothetical protein
MSPVNSHFFAHACHKLQKLKQVTRKVGSTPEEAKSLFEVGFEYIYEKEELTFFRKRK